MTRLSNLLPPSLSHPAVSHSKSDSTAPDNKAPDGTVADGKPAAWRYVAIAAGLAVVCALMGLAGGKLSAIRSWLAQRPRDDRPVIAVVKRMDLPVVVTAGGELTSADAVEVVCELEGQGHKIIEMLPEGTIVTQGQVVIRLDSAAIQDRLAEQRLKVAQSEAAAKSAAESLKIQQNLSASKVAQAELARQLAVLDQEKYVEGDYKVELSTLQGSIALAKVELQDAEVALGYNRDLVKKGFRSPEELRAKEQTVERAKYNLTRDEEKLKVLETYVRRRQLVELEAKAQEAARELERAQSSAKAGDSKAQTDLDVAVAMADLERQQLARIDKQIELCIVRAAADGAVIYAKDKSKPIELGGVVHYKQKLFSVPNSTSMKVDTYVHESVIKRVKPGMKAEVRLDAFTDVRMRGTVQNVATYYDATRQWLSGGVKDYATTLTLDEAPGVPLRNGMTAQVTILAERHPGVLVVPVAAVAEISGSYHCFVATGNDFVARSVTTGANSDELVEIVAGLNEGEQVALDAAVRARSVEPPKVQVAAKVQDAAQESPQKSAAESAPATPVP